jgi:hypothetical protein
MREKSGNTAGAPADVITAEAPAEASQPEALPGMPEEPVPTADAAADTSAPQQDESAGGDGVDHVPMRAKPGRLAVDTAFLESGESPPTTTDRPPPRVGRLKDPHSFLAGGDGDGPHDTDKGRAPASVGKLTKDLAFLQGAASTPDGEDRSVKRVGRLSVDMSAFSPDAEPPRARAQTAAPKKLVVSGAFGVQDESGGLSNCPVCDKKVFPMEKVSIDGDTYHKWCLRCSECNKVLSAGSYAKVHGVLFCKPHFQQLFKSKGNYDEVGATVTLTVLLRTVPIHPSIRSPLTLTLCIALLSRGLDTTLESGISSKVTPHPTEASSHTKTRNWKTMARTCCSWCAMPHPPNSCSSQWTSFCDQTSSAATALAAMRFALPALCSNSLQCPLPTRAPSFEWITLLCRHVWYIFAAVPAFMVLMA